MPTTNGLAHHVVMTQCRGIPVKLVIMIYLEANTDDRSWACFMVAAFYDMSEQILWRKEIFIACRSNSSNRMRRAARGWAMIPGYQSQQTPFGQCK